MKRKRPWKYIILGCLFLTLLSGCGAASPETPPLETTKIPTSIPVHTLTPEPTLLPSSTPTKTPIPTITPLPMFEDAEFPTGVFITDIPGVDSYDFYKDGTVIVHNPGIIGVSGNYGVNGNLLVITNGDGAFTRQVPATYYWYFDGAHLTFQVWGEDLSWLRERDLNGKVYTLTDEPLPARESEPDQLEFPTGTFVLDADRYYAVEFNQDGTWNAYESEGAAPSASGKYVTHGNLYTEMTHNYPDTRKVPVTYYWTFDGENLIFSLEGYRDFEDVIPERKALFDGQTYIKTE